ncbi:MAG: hypothetical protein ACR2QK_04990 [Acidimicrobiales bacterium]
MGERIREWLNDVFGFGLSLRSPQAANRPMPVAALLCRLFLLTGWLRAVGAKLLADDWWSGAQVQAFLADHQPIAIADQIVESLLRPHPDTVAAVVVAAQLSIVAGLVFRRTVPIGLTIGAALNIGFIIGGKVDPSVFYLVLALVVALGRAEFRRPQSSYRVESIAATVGAAVISIVLVPHIETVHPDHVIEDPAAVLVFLAWLAVAALWLLESRSRHWTEAVSG